MDTELVWEDGERDVFTVWAKELIEQIEGLLAKYAEFDRLFPLPAEP